MSHQKLPSDPISIFPQKKRKTDQEDYLGGTEFPVCGGVPEKAEGHMKEYWT